MSVGTKTQASSSGGICALIGNCYDELLADGYYYALSGSQFSNAEVRAREVIPYAGTFKNLYFILTVAPGVGNTRRIRLRVNGVNTAIIVSISGAATTGSNTVDTVNVSAGDYVTVMPYVFTGAPPDSYGAWGIEFVSR